MGRRSCLRVSHSRKFLWTRRSRHLVHNLSPALSKFSSHGLTYIIHMLWHPREAKLSKKANKAHECNIFKRISTGCLWNYKNIKHFDDSGNSSVNAPIKIFCSSSLILLNLHQCYAWNYQASAWPPRFSHKICSLGSPPRHVPTAILWIWQNPAQCNGGGRFFHNNPHCNLFCHLKETSVKKVEQHVKVWHGSQLWQWSRKQWHGATPGLLPPR